MDESKITKALHQAINAGMFSGFPSMLYQKAEPACTHTMTATGFGAAIAETEAKIKSELEALSKRIAAEEKAAPVVAAIAAMHGSRRSDGRPHEYRDPLRKGD